MMSSGQQVKQIPLGMIGGNTFGRYPKISIAQTWNMIVSDEMLVDYAGYKNVLSLQSDARGRQIYSSSRGNFMLAVEGNYVYKITSAIGKVFIGTLLTQSGDVFIAENNNKQIAITDGIYMYVYNYDTGTFHIGKASGGDFTISFLPGYITFQNGRLICAGIGTTSWFLSGLNDAESWPASASTTGSLQTKPDTVQGAIPFPGRGNLLFVFGKTVTEPWTDVGAALFPYQKQTNFNIDYGCLNPNTIAENEDMIVWLSGNEQSGPVIMYSTGGEIKRISTDGIDFKLSRLTAPTDSSGFLFRQDGHLIYQITFKTDNISYIYDFNTQKFFSVSDENLNYHIAKKVVFFNNKYYFVSFNDGNLYEFGTNFSYLQYSATSIKEMPRIRITAPLRLPTQEWYIGRSVGFTIENGQENAITYIENTEPSDEFIVSQAGAFIVSQNGDFIISQDENVVSITTLSNMRIDLSMSRDGGESFGNSWGQDMNPTGKRKSRFLYQRLGIVNDATYQFRFWGFSRYVVAEGLLEYYT